MTDNRDRRRRWVNRGSKVFHLLQRLGVRTGRAQILTTTGRKSGRPRSQPIGVVAIDGAHFIFQAYPNAAWVANARANPSATLASGKRVRAVELREMPLEQSRELLRCQLHGEPEIGKQLIKSGLITDQSPDGVAAAAEHIAVFRVDEPTAHTT